MIELHTTSITAFRGKRYIPQVRCSVLFCCMSVVFVFVFDVVFVFGVVFVFVFDVVFVFDCGIVYEGGLLT